MEQTTIVEEIESKSGEHGLEQSAEVEKCEDLQKAQIKECAKIGHDGTDLNVIQDLPDSFNGKDRTEKTLQLCPEPSLYQKCVRKTIIVDGSRGHRCTPCSKCRVSVRNIVLLNPAFKKELEESLMFRPTLGEEAVIEIDIVLGSSDSVLDTALEVALLSMDDGEVSEVILCLPPRDNKTVDKIPERVPCVKCVIHLLALQRAEWEFEEADEKKYELALHEKQIGTDLFRKNRTVEAFHRFAVAAKVLMTTNCVLLETEDTNKDIEILLSTLYSNMAECQIRKKNLTFAVLLCRKALSLAPDNVKALYRQASAAWSLGDVDQADDSLKKLFVIEPNNIAAKHLNDEVQQKIKMYEKEYTQMMKRIFGK